MILEVIGKSLFSRNDVRISSKIYNPRVICKYYLLSVARIEMKLFLFIFIISLSVSAADFTIQRFNGEVFINSTKVSTENSKSLDIKIGDVVEARDKQSFIQVKSSRGSTLLIRNGSIILDKFNNKTTVIQLLKGKFFHFLDTRKNKRNFIIKTKTASLGVRGTKYMVEATDEKTYLCVCEGKVAIKSNTTKRLYLTKKGEDIDILNTMADFKVRKASDLMFNMTSKEFSDMGHPL